MSANGNSASEGYVATSVIRDETISALTKSVYTQLATMCSPDGVVTVSIGDLAYAAGLSERSAQKAAHDGEAAGVWTITTGRRGMPNRYQLHDFPEDAANPRKQTSAATSTPPYRPAWQRRVTDKRRALADRDGWSCAYCTRALANPEDDSHWRWDGGGEYVICPRGDHDDGGCVHPEGLWFTAEHVVSSVVEHVIPRAKGGSNHLDNLVLACDGCNIAKAARLLPELEPDWWSRVARGRDARTWSASELDSQRPVVAAIWARAAQRRASQLQTEAVALTEAAGIPVHNYGDRSST